MCVSCQTTTLDSQSLECENTYTPARREALFSVHFVAPTSSAGCESWMFFSKRTFFQQTLIDMLFISFESTFPAWCLQCRCPSCSRRCRSVSLSRDCSASNVVWNCCGIDPCGESCYDAVHVPCVGLLLQELRSQTGTFGSELMLSNSAVLFSMFAVIASS